MKHVRLLPLVFVSFLLAACGASLTQENYEKIQNGMTEEQVKALISEPTHVERMGVGEFSGAKFEYENGPTGATILFFNGVVSLKQGYF